MSIAPTPRFPTHLFSDTLTVERNTPTVDTGGSVVDSWATHLTAVPCVPLQPFSGEESVRYGAERTRRLWRTFVRFGLDVTPGDRVKWTPQGQSEITFDIQSVLDQAGRTIMYELVLEETG